MDLLFSNDAESFGDSGVHKKQFLAKCEELAVYSKTAKKVLRSEITVLEKSLYYNQADIEASRNSAWKKYISNADSVETEKRSIQN